MNASKGFIHEFISFKAQKIKWFPDVIKHYQDELYQIENEMFF